MTLDSSATISPDKFFVVCLFHDFWIHTDAVNIVLCSIQRACRIDTFQLSAFNLNLSSNTDCFHSKCSFDCSVA